jgi:hypothetical protein
VRALTSSEPSRRSASKTFPPEVNLACDKTASTPESFEIVTETPVVVDPINVLYSSTESVHCLIECDHRDRGLPFWSYQLYVYPGSHPTMSKQIRIAANRAAYCGVGRTATRGIGKLDRFMVGILHARGDYEPLVTSSPRRGGVWATRLAEQSQQVPTASRRLGICIHRWPVVGSR